VAKRRVGRYSNEFRRMCVERMKQCDDIVALAAELDIHRRLLYRWRDQLDPVDKGEWPPPQNSRESTLRKEVSQLKRVLADKTVELDFLKGALQKSRLDGSRATTLAGRHLRPNPGSDVLARQREYRADVSTGPSESRGLLPIVA
jgi:transposase-like protein